MNSSDEVPYAEVVELPQEPSIGVRFSGEQLRQAFRNKFPLSMERFQDNRHLIIDLPWQNGALQDFMKILENGVSIKELEVCISLPKLSAILFCMYLPFPEGPKLMKITEKNEKYRQEYSPWVPREVSLSLFMDIISFREYHVEQIIKQQCKSSSETTTPSPKKAKVDHQEENQVDFIELVAKLKDMKSKLHRDVFLASEEVRKIKGLMDSFLSGDFT